MRLHTSARLKRRKHGLGILYLVLLCCTSRVSLGESSSSTTTTTTNPFDPNFGRSAAGKLMQSLGHQAVHNVYRTPKEHVHRKFLKETFGPAALSPISETAAQQFPTAATESATAAPPPTAPPPTTTTTLPPSSWNRLAKVALAGGIAGATGTAALYPIDAAKTLRQSAPALYGSVRHALGRLLRDERTHRLTLGRVYCGVLPATLGAIPSSALYFGAYETAKPWIRRRCAHQPWAQTMPGRVGLHALAAAAGNVLSSAVFVPKEVIKQHMQYVGGNAMGRAIKDIVQKHGIRGLYSGYSATLMRNIPSAVLRFTVYEELKQIFVLDNDRETQKTGFNLKLFLAGAAAGAVSSGLMTPVDVMKTRMATGTCPVDLPGCLQHVIEEGGVSGLYMGAGSRIIWSTVFAAIGFGMLETAKGWLGVSDVVVVAPTEPKQKTKRTYQMFSRHQRSLEHAVSDKYE